MTNQEVFANYGSEQGVIEENLSLLLLMYWEEVYNKYPDTKITRHQPINTVSFVKRFMEQDTNCGVEYAEKSKMETLEAAVVADVDADVLETAVVTDVDANVLKTAAVIDVDADFV